MPDELSLVTLLPVMSEIERRLLDSDKSRLALTGKVFYRRDITFSSLHPSIFYNARIRTKCEYVQQLLTHIARGEQGLAEIMIKNDPGLLLESGTLFDKFARRTFKSITAFQYTLWARDRHMWRMILNYLPIDIALQQKTELETNGTAYGKQFDFEPIKKAYQKYLEYRAFFHKLSVSVMSAHKDELHDLWFDIGKEQCKLPAHVIQEYLHPKRSFRVMDGAPNFNDEEGLPRVTTFNEKDIFSLPLDTFVVFRRGDFSPDIITGQPSDITTGQPYYFPPVYDSAAINRLCEVRNAEYLHLAQELELSFKKSMMLR